MRVAAVAAVLGAPLLPPTHREGRGRSVVYVLDRSQSVGTADRARAARFVKDALAKRGDAEIGVVTFAAKASLALTPGDRRDPEQALGPDAGGEATEPGSDLAAAVRLAASALPGAGERRIVLLTDGRGTRGDALDEVRRAREDGIEVDAVPLGAAPPDRKAVARVTALEPRIAEGEAASFTVELHGPPGESVTYRWSRDGEAQPAQTAVLDEHGAAELTVNDPKPGPGLHVYDAAIVDFDHPGPASRAQAAVAVSGKPRVVVVTPDGECPGVLADALDRAETTREVVSVTGFAPDAASLSGTDLVVLADVPLARAGDTEGSGLTTKAQEALIDYVRERGGGVVATGGTFGFAPEYASAPIARMLPVEIQDQGQVEDPRVAMAIMLDRSGSMSAMAGTHTKLELAVEAALASATTLRPDDLLAITSVDEKTNWNFPLGPVASLVQHKDRVRAIDAGGGGIFVYTALADAYKALRPIPTPVRHVLLFSDTDDSEEQFEGCPFAPCPPDATPAAKLAEQARKAGITTSVVGIGNEEDHDTAFLVRLAAAGGGRFYLTSKGSDLRRIFVSETRLAARSNVREGATEITVAGAHPILAGIDAASVPKLGGIVETNRRATADTPMSTKDGKPVLAAWRYGIGNVVALTTDVRADWKGSWSEWREAGQVLRQMARFAMRRRAATGAEARLTVRERSVELALEAAGGGEGAAEPATIEAFTIAPVEPGAEATPSAPPPPPKPDPLAGLLGVVKPLEIKPPPPRTARLVPLAMQLERVAPGRYVARGTTDGAALVMARVRAKNGGLVAEAVGQTDASTELHGLGPDVRALGELARAGDGAYEPDVERSLRAGGPRGREPVATWPWALLAAAGLVCVDLWLRRLPPKRARRPKPAAVAEPAAVPEPVHAPEPAPVAEPARPAPELARPLVDLGPPLSARSMVQPDV